MIAPADALAQVQNGSKTTRVAVLPAPATTPNQVVAVDERRLSAPLAHFDDGFSSDQGAFLSGAETEREVTPTTDRDDSPDRTPVRDLPRTAGASVQSPLTAAETGEHCDDLGGGEEDDEDGDIVKTAKITISPPKDVAADEARASLLLHQHDSLDLDMDMDEAPNSSPTPLQPTASTGNQAPTLSRNESFSGSSSPNAINQQLRQQYEIQAVSRPRPTTPVSACAIESFVAVNPRRTSDAEKMKISLPSSSFVAGSGATTDLETQPEEPKQAVTGAAGYRTHRRRSSMSWSEFQENMAAATSGRVSGRTTPVSCADVDHDLLEQNPVYQDRVPPSPVVHRRASREWVDFEGVEIGASESGEFKPPPLRELVTEIQQTVDAWHRTDYENTPAPMDTQGTTEQEYPGYEELKQGQEQYAPPPFDGNIGNYAEGSWQQQTTYGPTDYASQQQRPPPEPQYGYGSYAVPPAEQKYSDYANAGVSSYDYDTNYAPPPPPVPASALLDNWSSQTCNNSLYEPSGLVNQSAWNTTAAMQYAQPASVSSAAHDDWDNSPYAQHQLSYQQQQQQPPPEPTGKGQQDLANEKPSTAAAPSRQAPEPPAPVTTAVVEKSPEQEKAGLSEEWLAYEKMTQKMNMVVKQSQEKLKDIQKATVANMLPSTPYEVAIGHVAQSPPQQPSAADSKAAPSAVAPLDLLSSDFEPIPPTATPALEQPQSSPPLSSFASDGGKGWKPIHEVLNDEIKKHKELNKPKRPPPPKAAPQRPPRPGGAAPTTTSVPSSWDDAPATTASPQPHFAASAAYPSWDEGDAAAQYYPQPNIAAAPRVDAFSAAPTAPAPAYDSGAIIVPTPASLSNTPNIDHEKEQVRSLPVESGYTGAVVSTDGSIPFTTSDIANQNHMQSNERPEDEALFDISKYSNVISGQAPMPAADNFDIFLKQEISAGAGAPPTVPPPPVPPPRSPGPERTFIIENQAFAPVLTQKAMSPAQVHNWADFDATDRGKAGAGSLPPSESDFYLKMTSIEQSDPNKVDPFAPQKNIYQPAVDLLGSVDTMEDSYDPFAVKSPEQIVAEAKAIAQAQLSAREAVDDLDFFGGGAEKGQKSNQEGEEEAGRSSPGFGFRDDFAPPQGETEGGAGDDDEDALPLYDEDDSLPLLEFPVKFTGDGWDMMLRFPVKKKMMAERCWKPVYVRLQGTNVELYYGKNDRLPFQTLPLLANYCLSDVTTQQYDVYGKIHTVKLQYVIYKEKVGIRPGQIPKLVEGHFTKLGLPLEHAAQTSVLLKFGSLQHDEMQTFVYAVEDVLFHITAVRERPALYKQDEIQVHCYDEYASHVNKDGAVSDQRARVRLFCLAFVSGMPFIEIGLNDRRRQGKEIVRRKDIMPMYTERWIRFEALEFHSSIDKPSFDKEHVIRMQPLDACFFEVLRFRVRPPRGKELPLHVRSIMKIAGSKIEIRIEAMVAVFKSRKARQVPCEDIQIRFPIPEAWIYLFREERHWGYGSVHAKVRRPGKVKNIRDKIMGIVQNTEQSLIEVAIGDAKYEHVYRSLVWRIPRLPEKHHGAYKTHLLRCRFELSSFDLMPETFIPNCDVEYTMPMATVSHTVVRSVSIEQHEDPDKVEKWVRYLAKYQYTVEIDYVQTTDLDIEAIMDTTVLEPEKSLEKAPVKHQPSLDVGVAKDAHEGYRIDFSEAELGGGRFDKSKGESGGKSSSDSSDDEDARGAKKPPLIQIDIKNYKY